MTKPNDIELICPAGTPAALRAAVDAGADSVYVGFDNETNARNFPGLNFNAQALREGIDYAHARGAKVLVAINTFPRAGHLELWHTSVGVAADAGADAVILADMGLCDYAARTYPSLRLHLSVQASASSPEAVNFYRDRFGIQRVVLPRVLTLREIADINKEIDIETEVFVFGGLCVMAEGRCSLSSYATGKSPNMNGVCSPASHVRYEERGARTVSRLGDFTINSFRPGEPAGYPTLCKGRFSANDEESYLFEEPTSLNTIPILPELIAAGVSAFKIEGRQRGRAYIAEVVSSFRTALDAAIAGAPIPEGLLAGVTEGGRQTTGAYEKAWR